MNLGCVFNRSGLASISDIQNPEWQKVFNFLDEEQSVFLSKEKKFRSSEYKWPRNSLHNWSRVWEYPYVFYHLNFLRQKNTNVEMPHLVDLGSGVTFFPFSLAKLGYRVTCTDIDPICEKDVKKAAQCVPHEPGHVEFRLIKGKNLPFYDSESDIVYCISVLEHIPDFENFVLEIVRILKPGGFLFLTIDIGLTGDSEIGVKEYYHLKKILNDHFIYLYPETVIHPKDMLHTHTGPYAFKEPQGFNLVWRFFKHWIAGPLIGRKLGSVFLPHVAVLGFALKKT